MLFWNNLLGTLLIHWYSWRLILLLQYTPTCNPAPTSNVFSPTPHNFCSIRTASSLLLEIITKTIMAALSEQCHRPGSAATASSILCTKRKNQETKHANESSRSIRCCCNCLPCWWFFASPLLEWRHTKMLISLATAESSQEILLRHNMNRLKSVVWSSRPSSGADDDSPLSTDCRWVSAVAANWRTITYMKEARSTTSESVLGVRLLVVVVVLSTCVATVDSDALILSCIVGKGACFWAGRGSISAAVTVSEVEEEESKWKVRSGNGMIWGWFWGAAR